MLIFPQCSKLKLSSFLFLSSLTAPSRQTWSLQRPPGKLVSPRPLLTLRTYLHLFLGLSTYFSRSLKSSTKLISEALKHAQQFKAGLKRQGIRFFRSQMISESTPFPPPRISSSHSFAYSSIMLTQPIPSSIAMHDFKPYFFLLPCHGYKTSLYLLKK